MGYIVLREKYQHCLIAPSVVWISVVPWSRPGRQVNRVLPRSFTCIAAETNRVVQVKYTNQGSIGSWASQAKARVAMFGSNGSGIVCFLVRKQGSRVVPASHIDRDGS